MRPSWARWSRAALLAAVGVVLAASVRPAGAAPVAVKPQLQIQIDNGKQSVTTGDLLTYTITVRNVGSTDVASVLVSQTIPVGLKMASVSAPGVLRSASVTWTGKLARGASATFRTTGSVQATPADVLRLASVACATVAEQPRPLVCAAHSDQLPAGRVAAAATKAAAAPQGRSEHGTGMEFTLGGFGLLALAGGFVLLYRRRRSGDDAADEH